MHTGLAPMESESDTLLNAQFDNFYISLVRKGDDGIKRPQSWFEAFLRLEKYLEKSDNGSLTNFRGWTPPNRVLCKHSKLSGIHGAVTGTTLWSLSAGVPIHGSRTISSITMAVCTTD